MKRNKRFIALAMSFGLIMSMFTGCGDGVAKKGTTDMVAEAVDIADNTVRTAVTDIPGAVISTMSTWTEALAETDPMASTMSDERSGSGAERATASINSTNSAVGNTGSSMTDDNKKTGSGETATQASTGSTAQASTGSTAQASTGSTAQASTGSTAQASTGSTAQASTGSTAQASTGSTAQASTPKPSDVKPPVQAPSTACVHGNWTGNPVVEDYGNCTARCYVERTCSKCGYTEICDDTGIVESHAFTTPVVVAGTCTQEGYQYHICAKCGAQGDTISMGTDPNAHDYVQSGSSVVQPGDCVTAEILEITYTCSWCGDSCSKWEQGSTDPGNHNNVLDDGTCICGTVVFTPEPAPTESSVPPEDSAPAEGVSSAQ